MTQDKLKIAQYINKDKSDSEIIVDVLEGLGRQNKGYYFSYIFEAIKKKCGGEWDEPRTHLALKDACQKGFITEITFKGLTSYRIPPILRRSPHQRKIGRSVGGEEKSQTYPAAKTLPNGSRDKKDVSCWAKLPPASPSRIPQQQSRHNFENDEVIVVDDINRTSPLSIVSYGKSSAKDTSDEDSTHTLTQKNINHINDVSEPDKVSHNMANQNGAEDMTENEELHEEFSRFKEYIRIELEKLSVKISDRNTEQVPHFEGNGVWEPQSIFPQNATTRVASEPNLSSTHNTHQIDKSGLEQKLASTQDVVLINLYQQRIKSLELELRKKQDVIDFLMKLVDNKAKNTRVKLNGYKMNGESRSSAAAST